MSSLPPLHIELLQTVKARGAVSEAEMLTLLRELVQLRTRELASSSFKRYTASGGVTKREVEECVSLINKEIEWTQFKLAKAHSAGDNTFYYGLVNLSNDVHAQKSHTFTQSQVALFNRVKEQLADDGSGELTSIGWLDAENLRLGLSGMDGDNSSHTLRKLVAQKWLATVGDDEDPDLVLGPRSALMMQYGQ
jgi:hypothetical protein